MLQDLIWLRCKQVLLWRSNSIYVGQFKKNINKVHQDCTRIIWTFQDHSYALTCLNFVSNLLWERALFCSDPLVPRIVSHPSAVTAISSWLNMIQWFNIGHTEMQITCCHEVTKLTKWLFAGDSPYSLLTIMKTFVSFINCFSDFVFVCFFSDKNFK